MEVIEVKGNLKKVKDKEEEMMEENEEEKECRRRRELSK